MTLLLNPKALEVSFAGSFGFSLFSCISSRAEMSVSGWDVEVGAPQVGGVSGTCTKVHTHKVGTGSPVLPQMFSPEF